MNLKTIKCVEGGHDYNISIRNHSKNVKLLEYCRDVFKQPCLYHFISGIEPKNFNRSRFSENFNRSFKKKSKQKMKGTWNNLPSYIGIYCLEYKLCDSKKVSGDYINKSNSLKKVNYHHMHLYLCFDCVSPYQPWQINSLVLETLNNIEGLYNSHYQLRKDNNLYYHNLNKEYDDAVNRIQYISKVEQKEGVPYREKNSFFKSIKSEYH